MGSGSLQARPSLLVPAADTRPDAALRLRQFRQEHPDVEILCRGPWEAVIREPDGGQRVIVRYALHELLDEAERRMLALAGEPGGSRP